MDIDDIARYREQHPAWKVLRADNAPLILAFLGDTFIQNNQGEVSASELTARLDDYLYALHLKNPDAYTATAATYIENWVSAEHGWLRRFYPLGSDDVYVDITPALESAYRWVEGLTSRTFVGSESRMQTLVELLRQIVYGSETDPQERIRELKKRRAEIDEEIERAENDDIALLDTASLRDRYQQFVIGSRDLLMDFRQVEENFRGLDRQARERIAVWSGGKGDLLEDLVATRIDISSSDQGRNFNAFYDFLVSEDLQEEIDGLLGSVEKMPELGADRRVRTIHHDWARAADRTQQTVRDLSEQLRRFLEERVWLENRRIVELTRSIESAAVRLREVRIPEGLGLEIDPIGLEISLPMERPLYAGRENSDIVSLIRPADAEEVDLAALLDQRYVDAGRLADNIRTEVLRNSSADLADIIVEHPITDGVAELLGYLTLNEEDIELEFEDSSLVEIVMDDDDSSRHVTMPRVRVVRR